MNILGTLLVLWGAAAVNIQLAPDQPIPYVYVDEPLIVEFKSEEPLTTPVHVEIEGEHRATVPLDLAPVSLRSHGTYWQTIDGAPVDRGLYRVKIVLVASNQEQQLSFCRVDRPAPSGKSPWGIDVTALDAPMLAAMAALPARAIHLDGAAPGAEAAASRAAAAGFQVSLIVDAAGQGADALAETLSKKLIDRVTRWDVISPANGDKVSAVAQAIQRGGSRSPVALVTDDAKSLGTALTAGAGQFVSGIVVRCGTGKADLALFRDAAELAGYEALPIVVWEKEPGANTREDQAFERLQVEYLSEGASESVFGGAGLFRDNAFQPAFPHMNALGLQLSGAVYVGDAPVEDGVSAHVFRKGNAWLVVFWSGSAIEIKLPVGDAAGLALSDGVNNPLTAPEVKDGAVSLTVEPGLSFLRGVGGTVLGQAAHRASRQAAKALNENNAIQKIMTKEYVEVVKTIAQLDAGKSSRMEYLALLRGFTMLEEQWHAGKVARASAVPALASLSRLSRSLCALQQEGGEPFVEPLRKTLARCGEYQSQYLTSSGGAQGARERGDWLSQEVSRLTAEAEALDKDGRGIEAAAVAAMAEWRARSLEFAAKAAPLSKPDPFAHLSVPDDEDSNGGDKAETKKSDDKKKATGAKPGAKKQSAPAPNKSKKQ
ncbi:MAG: hypothetical protein HZB26_19135 [Candidatus Hydrogenedentes bacterium]|nr:hypothetical protein [Candidatus Hydrogenedentota bacterium]